MLHCVFHTQPQWTAATGPVRDTDWVIVLFVDYCFLPVQSLCEEVNSGTPGLEDPH